MMEVRTILVKTAAHCNLACKYCYAEAPVNRPAFVELDFAVRVFRELCEAGSLGRNVLWIWHGGEPTLYSAIQAREIQQEVSQYAEQAGITVNFSLQTNGYCISDEWLSLLHDYDMHCSVSLDGPPEIHNAARRTAGGIPTYATIIENLRRLKESGISLALLSVIDERHAAHSSEWCEWLRGMSLSARANPCFGEKMQFWDLYFDFMLEVFRWLMRQEENISIQPLEGLLRALITDTEPDECSFGGHCEDNFVCIHPDNQLGICGRLRETCSAAPGEVNNTLTRLAGSLAKIRSSFKARMACADCQFVRQCNGFCPAMHMLEAGDTSYCRGFTSFMHRLCQEGLPAIRVKLLEEQRRVRQQLLRNKDMLEELEKK